MGKILPNFITMDFYEKNYLTKDYVIVKSDKKIESEQKKNQDNNKSMFKYIISSISDIIFW